MIIGERNFDINTHTYIVGILNITPNSFSDGGKYTNIDNAMYHVDEMINEGADIIDIGGESTKPGYVMISEDEEINRILPIIREIKKNFHIPISIDTYKSKVAIEAIKSGADLINDIWGLKYDNLLGHIIKDYNVACCLMHNREKAIYNNLIEDVKNDLCESIVIAEKLGIPTNKIILDPGIGFGKSNKDSVKLLSNLDKLNSLGYPLLVGASRKSVIGDVLNLPVDERLEGTLVTTMIAVLKNCSFVRVHDIKSNYRTIKMTECLKINMG